MTDMLAVGRRRWKGGIAAVGKKRISPGRPRLRRLFRQIALQNAARLPSTFPETLNVDHKKASKINFMGE
jgi:hypothetical protein